MGVAITSAGEVRLAAGQSEEALRRLEHAERGQKADARADSGSSHGMRGRLGRVELNAWEWEWNWQAAERGDGSS